MYKRLILIKEERYKPRTLSSLYL